MIELGGGISTLGATLEGYAQGGVLGDAMRGGTSVLLDKLSHFVVGKKFPEIDDATKSATATILSQIPDALIHWETSCGG
jgi:hypothetical protein